MAVTDRPTQLNATDFTYAMRPDTVLRGQFMCRLGHDDWAGLDNLDGQPMLFRGSFRDVIETFVPYNGTTREISDSMDGVYRTSDVLKRIPMDEWSKHGKRSGVKRKRDLSA